MDNTYPLVLDFDALKQEMNLTDKAIEASGFSSEELQGIYSDYLSRLDDLNKIKDEFITKFFVPANGLHIHSYGGRVKHPMHLIEKIVRKRSTNDRKYKDMIKDDYYKYITDLIGCRVLLVYKEDWIHVHDYLTQEFPEYDYVDSDHYADSYDNAKKDIFMAEKPVAHMRSGDKDIYSETRPNLAVKYGRYYRSVHYIIRYGQYYIEVQVRTLADEAWGEVDHDVLYPYYKDDPVLVDFSSLINRTSGMTDEMSAYLKTTLVNMRPKEIKGTMLDVPSVSVGPHPTDNTDSGIGGSVKLETPSLLPLKGSSAKDMLNSLILENGV